jgi:micrococcal nuclease
MLARLEGYRWSVIAPMALIGALAMLSPSLAAPGNPPVHDATTALSAKVERLYGNFEWMDGEVVAVIDGDTIDVKIGPRSVERVRIVEIDAPERGAPHWRASKQDLSNLVFGQRIEVAVVGRHRTDELIGRIYRWSPAERSFVDVTREMIARGAALVDRSPGKGRASGKDPDLDSVEAEARRAQRGFWSLPPAQQISPWDWRKMPKGERDLHR